MRTVDEILRPERGSRQESPFDKGLRKMRRIARLLDELEKAAGDRDEDWEKIYNAIFSREKKSIKNRATRAVDLAGRSFPDYYDPDTTYEADARAWIGAFREVLNKATNDDT